MDKKLEINISTIITIVSFIFTAGIAYGKFTALEEHVQTLELRLDKKIKTINYLEDELHDLEVELATLKATVEPKHSDQ